MINKDYSHLDPESKDYWKILKKGYDIKGYYWGGNKDYPKYKVEYKDTLKIEMKPKYIRCDKYKHVEQIFNIINDVEDNNFTPLIDKILDLKTGCFITGIAGS
jgi:hypothetical protein